MCMRRSANAILMMLMVLTFCSCYRKTEDRNIVLDDSIEEIADSNECVVNRHYTRNYNFVVDCDSLVLQSQQPEERISDLPTDSFAVYKHQHLVVADIRVIPDDAEDSVWVQLATDRAMFGWVHEHEMVKKVVPDDPISQFINTFSDTHIILFLVFLVVISVFYLARTLRNKNVHIVHFRDIDSFFPMLLCQVVALSASLYASIQTFAPDMWQHFYYYPTLNPFSVPLLLGIFLSSVWAILIIGLAVVDDVFHRLKFVDASLYLGGVAAICAVNYVIFSVTTLYYIGYLLLAAYLYLSAKRYLASNDKPYVCGNCGSRIKSKGKCPYCDTMNE